ncbi:MAG: glycoside hydrolase family 57 [Opitutae bacterium]|nr:glycoside hydrolase family 57 [Opitutae bacterium]
MAPTQRPTSQPKPGVIFLPHGNLQYSQLRPEKRGWVAAQTYGPLFALSAEMDAPLAFEASGETLEIIAAAAPQVLDQLKAGIKEGRIEPVGSPHTHIMLANIDPEIGLESLREGLDTWERLTGVRPVTGWNPECSWAGFIPEIFRAAGYETLIGDADSYLLSSVPGLREATGLRFDVRGHSNKNALFKIEAEIARRPEVLETLIRPNLLSNGLRVILRSDMMCNILLWYLMGATEGNREQPISADEVRATLARWRDRIPGGNGFLLPYAEDAEYVGTTAYFYVKQFGLARFFEPAPDSVTRFRNVLRIARELDFRLITPREAVATYAAIPGRGFESIENGCAWHGGTAKAWANTPHARLLDPVCRSMHEGLKAIAATLRIDEMRRDAEFRTVMRQITTAYVSDARWPPAPTSPGRFNVQEALDALSAANEGIARLMVTHGLADHRSLYSPAIMRTQIAAIADELMGMTYFEEKGVAAPAA